MLVFRREERKTISTVLINANNFNFLEEIIQSFFYFCPVTVTVPLPPRYHPVTVWRSSFPNVPQRSSSLPIVPQRDIPLPTVTHRYLPLLTVTYRYSPLPTVTHRYLPLPTPLLNSIK